VFEFLLGVLFEFVAETLFAIAGSALAEAMGDDKQSNPTLAGIGHVLMGIVAGAISLMLLRRQLIAAPPVPGISLLVAPVCTGLALRALGDWSVRRGAVRSALFTFRGGFWFAAGMAATRFTYFYFFAG